MGNLRLNRIFIRDDKGNLFRICNISHSVDKYNEAYLKVVFPDLKNKKIERMDIPKDVKEESIIDSKFNIEESDEIHEITFHYEGGVQTFKNRDGKIIEKIDLPILKGNKGLKLIRIKLDNLSIFKLYKGLPTGNDIVLRYNFNGIQRIFSLYLIDGINIKLLNNHPDVEVIDHYVIKVNKSKKYFIFTDGLILKSVIKVGLSLFVYENEILSS